MATKHSEYGVSLSLNICEVVDINSSCKTSVSNKKKKPASTPERMDPRIKRSKSDVKVFRKNYESEKENHVDVSMKTSFSSSTDEDPGVRIDRARITRSFSQVLVRDEKANLCRICSKSVFLMDRIKAEKGVFHKFCFRCKECTKQLTVDSYSSHEGILYCKPHFKQLFQPKVKFDEEAPIHHRPKRNEMIIKENTPMELPPDVIRSSDKPDYGLDELPSLRNIKSRFESTDPDSDLVRSPSQVAVKRSESILSRMARFQSINENGQYEDSSSSEEDEDQDPDVVRESRKKEKMSDQVMPETTEEMTFGGMNQLKSQWETGNLSGREEEWNREKHDELNKLRQRICHGKNNLKAVYENAVQESEKSVVKEAMLDGEIGDVSTSSIKDKWERGEVLNEIEQEKQEKFSREKEDDLSVFKESGTSNEARTIFKKIDETAAKTPVHVTPKKSPSIERTRSRDVLYTSSVNQVGSADTEIIRAVEAVKKEEIMIDPTIIHEKFKFFENYQDPQSKTERKRFAMTPPRETTNGEEDEADGPEIERDPNIIRAGDPVSEDMMVTDTARKMLNKFRELENQTGSDESPQGLKPLKRITPPREFTRTFSDSSDEGDSRESTPSRDPNIIRACDKLEDTVLIDAEKTRQIRSKFERWEESESEVERENRRNMTDEVQPSIDTTKNLKAKFEALREEHNKSMDKPKPKVNRFVQDETNSGSEYCNMCEKRVYAMEKIEASGLKFHKGCFKCSQCSCILRLDNYTTSEGILYCTPHFKQLFISRGNYDEGFGREQHKEKWNRSRSTTPTPHEFNGNSEYTNCETEEIYA